MVTETWILWSPATIRLIQVFHNDGNGEFTLVNEVTPPNGYAYYGPDWLVVGDFTGDGYARRYASPRVERPAGLDGRRR